MTGDTILRTLGDLARQSLDWRGELHAEMRLVEDLELDSLRLLTLAMAVEDHYQVCLDEDDEASIVTVGDLIELVQRKVAERRLASA